MFTLDFFYVLLIMLKAEENIYCLTSWKSSQVLSFKCQSNRKYPMSKDLIEHQLLLHLDENICQWARGDLEIHHKK